MSEVGVPAAVWQQEDHIKRVRSCKRVVGQAHAWRAFAAPTEYTGDDEFQRCVVCGVSRQRLPIEFYDRLAARASR